MSEQYLSEIRIFSFNYPPQGWALCNGARLAIAQNQALFALLGTNYGGDGVTNFCLPDLRGRAPVHVGGSVTLGQIYGEETHALSSTEIPSHTHTAMGNSANADKITPVSNVWAAQDAKPYGTTIDTTMQPLANAGSGTGHQNMQPYLVLNFCIATMGIFPSRN